jgi:hypothetical protein
VRAGTRIPTAVALRYLLGIIIGTVLLVILFAWVLVDTYQSVDLPATPFPIRVAAIVMLYAASAAALAYVSRDATWEWGLRVSLPTLVVLGIDLLLEGFPISTTALLAGILAAACAGSWLGSRLARRRAADKSVPTETSARTKE